MAEPELASRFTVILQKETTTLSASDLPVLTENFPSLGKLETQQEFLLVLKKLFGFLEAQKAISIVSLSNPTGNTPEIRCVLALVDHAIKSFESIPALVFEMKPQTFGRKKSLVGRLIFLIFAVRVLGSGRITIKDTDVLEDLLPMTLNQLRKILRVRMTLDSSENKEPETKSQVPLLDSFSAETIVKIAKALKEKLKVPKEASRSLYSLHKSISSSLSENQTFFKEKPEKTPALGKYYIILFCLFILQGLIDLEESSGNHKAFQDLMDKAKTTKQLLLDFIISLHPNTEELVENYVEDVRVSKRLGRAYDPNPFSVPTFSSYSLPPAQSMVFLLKTSVENNSSFVRLWSREFRLKTAASLLKLCFQNKNQMELSLIDPQNKVWMISHVSQLLKDYRDSLDQPRQKESPLNSLSFSSYPEILVNKHLVFGLLVLATGTENKSHSDLAFQLADDLLKIASLDSFETLIELLKRILLMCDDNSITNFLFSRWQALLQQKTKGEEFTKDQLAQPGVFAAAPLIMIMRSLVRNIETMDPPNIDLFASFEGLIRLVSEVIQLRIKHAKDKEAADQTIFGRKFGCFLKRFGTNDLKRVETAFETCLRGAEMTVNEEIKGTKERFEKYLVIQSQWNQLKLLYKEHQEKLEKN